MAGHKPHHHQNNRESKWATWHSLMVRISKSKDAKQAWSTVHSLSNRESHATVKSLLYRGRVYASDRSKTSAFDQEYTKISGYKSDMDSRKAVMDLRCLTRSTRTTPRQQINELQQALSQLTAGKAAGPDGITPDLHKHLLTKGSPVPLTILNSS